MVIDMGLRQHLSRVTTASDLSSPSLLCPLQEHLRALLGWHSGVWGGAAWSGHGGTGHVTGGKTCCAAAGAWSAQLPAAQVWAGAAETCLTDAVSSRDGRHPVTEMRRGVTVWPLQTEEGHPHRECSS